MDGWAGGCATDGHGDGEMLCGQDFFLEGERVKEWFSELRNVSAERFLPPNGKGKKAGWRKQARSDWGSIADKSGSE